MRFEIFNGRKEVIVDDKKFEFYNKMVTMDVKRIEVLLALEDVDSDTNLTTEELSKIIDKAMDNEFEFAYQMTEGGKIREALELHRQQLKEEAENS